LDVEIRLRSKTQWEYKLVGKGFPFTQENDMAVDEPAVDDMVTFSSSMGSADNWQEVLRKVGSKLLEVMSRKQSFGWDMSEGLIQAGGEDNVRVRFVLRPEFHNLMLEAVTCPRSRDRYWMLSAPIYRRLLVDGATTGGYFFEGGQQINCLIIDAAT